MNKHIQLNEMNLEDKKRYCVENIALLDYMVLRNLAINISKQGVVFKQTGDTIYVNINTLNEELIDYIKNYIESNLFAN